MGQSPAGLLREPLFVKLPSFPGGLQLEAVTSAILSPDGICRGGTELARGGGMVKDLIFSYENIRGAKRNDPLP